MTGRDAPMLVALAAIGCALMLTSCLVGPSALSICAAFNAFVGGGAVGDRIVVWEIRAPRALAAYLTGAALGLSGAALQGLLRNPLAEPGVLGVSASASLGATCAIYFGLTALWPWATPLAAILGAAAATALLAMSAAHAPSPASLILIGVGISSFAGALMALILNFAPNPFSLSDLVNWMLGSVANRSFADIAFAAPFMVIAAILITLSRRGLAALSLGEEGAYAVGANLKQTRLFVVLGAGAATGAAVALAGVIGFVGIIAPHAVRPFVSHDPARVLAPAALVGGAILCAADLFVRLSATAQELKLGVAAALLGAPAFVWIALHRRGSQ